MRGYDPEDPRVPTRAEAEADAYQDDIDRGLRDAKVKHVLDSLDFADRFDLLDAVCPTPWYPIHDNHERCRRCVEALLPAVARIVHRHMEA